MTIAAETVIPHVADDSPSAGVLVEIGNNMKAQP